MRRTLPLSLTMAYVPFVSGCRVQKLVPLGRHPLSIRCIGYPALTSVRSGSGPTSRRTRVLAMQRFYWLIDNVLAGCSRPGAGRDGDLDRDLAILRGYGIGALLTLTETALPPGALDRHGIAGLHLPV